MAVPWTNRDQSVFVPLNDYVATFIGMVRDDVAVQHRTVCRPHLYGEWRDAGGFGHQQRALRGRREQFGEPVRRAAAGHAVVGAREFLPAATAGLLTSRASSEAFFIDGTNRAMFRFTMMNHMCRDMEQVHDTSLPPDRIRQDVSR